MNPPIPMLAKILIGSFATLAVGAGVWTAVSVHNRGKVDSAATAATSSEAAAAITPVVASALSQENVSADTSSSSSDARSSAAKSTTKVQVESKSISKPSVKADRETALDASLSIATAMNQITIAVIANQPVVVGFAPLSGSFVDSDYANAKTLTFQKSVSSRTLVVRTKSGQQQTFSIAAATDSSTGSTSVSSASGSVSSSFSTSINIQSN